MGTAVVILAAGKGTRMQSDLPKVLHPVAQVPMLAHALRTAQSIDPDHIVVVAGHGFDAVARAVRDYHDSAIIVEQTEQLGTGHAVAQTRDALGDYDGDILVLYGDTPFISEDTIEQIGTARQSSDLVVLGFHAKDPARYGRLITNNDHLTRIVEFKDASDTERAITLCNSGVMCAKASDLFAWIDQTENTNASGEYYLTDCVEIATAHGKIARVVICDEAETMGVNSRVDLAQAEAAFQTRIRQNMLETGSHFLRQKPYFSPMTRSLVATASSSRTLCSDQMSPSKAARLFARSATLKVAMSPATASWAHMPDCVLVLS